MGLLRRLGVIDFFVVIGFASLVLQLDTFVSDPGVGWHLANADYLYINRALPTTDPFLSAPDPRPWIADQWLADLAMGGLFRKFDWPVVYAVAAVFMMATYFGVLFTCLRRQTGSALASTFAVLVAFKVSQVHFLFRPVLLCFMFFAIVSCALATLIGQLRAGDEGRARTTMTRLAVGFPILFALWANIHPTFVLGLVLIALAALSIWCDRLLWPLECQNHQDRSLAWRLLVVLGLSAGATLINPWGINLHRSILALGNSTFAMSYYMEWQPPRIGSYEWHLVEMTLAVVMVALLMCGRAALRWFSYELMLIAGFTHLAFGAVRMLPYFSIALALPLAQAVIGLARLDLWNRGGFVKRFGSAVSRLARHENGTWGGRATLLVVSVVLVLVTLMQRAVPLYPGTYGPSAKQYPFKALAALVDAIPKEDGGAPITVANDMTWGGFITYYGKGRVRAIVDDRTVLLGDPFYIEFFARLAPGADWREYLVQFKAGFLLLNRNSDLARVLVAYRELPVVYEDDLAILFRVTDGPRSR